MSVSRSKQAPSDLRVLTEKRKGVPPGTTSIISHLLSVTGMHSLYLLFKVCPLPNRKVTLESCRMTRWRTVSGSLKSKSGTRFSPMTLRVAPVSVTQSATPSAMRAFSVESGSVSDDARASGFSKLAGPCSCLTLSLGDSGLGDRRVQVLKSRMN